ERRVVAHQTEVVFPGFDLAQLGGPDRPVLDRDLVLLARAVVGNREGLVAGGHVSAISLLGLGGHGTPPWRLRAVFCHPPRRRGSAHHSSTREWSAGSLGPGSR